jgi:glycosyltransferase involved in cell wall biosynthesis
MPARKWKWRMRGASIWFARQATEWLDCVADNSIDVILCNDMLSVADLRALLPASMRQVPIVCYFHENQLTYPIPDEQLRDYQYGMTNITSCLSADAVWFNSQFHRDDFLGAVAMLLAKMPDCVPSGVVDEIRKKSSVIPPPVSVGGVERKAALVGASPAILWCHRWEYDKNPEPFFEAMIRLADAGRAFRLVVLGEQFRTAPPVFADSWDRLKPHIDHAGYIPDRQTYLSILAGCDLVVSSAIQENFGIAVVEAILLGCQPLLPNRLSYPGLIPPNLHDMCLYPSDADLFGRLEAWLEGRASLSRKQHSDLIAHSEAEFGTLSVIPRIDAALEATVRL